MKTKLITKDKTPYDLSKVKDRYIRFECDKTPYDLNLKSNKNRKLK